MNETRDIQRDLTNERFNAYSWLYIDALIKARDAGDMSLFDSSQEHYQQIFSLSDEENAQLANRAEIEVNWLTDAMWEDFIND